MGEHRRLASIRDRITWTALDCRSSQFCRAEQRHLPSEAASRALSAGRPFACCFAKTSADEPQVSAHRRALLQFSRNRGDRPERCLRSDQRAQNQARQGGVRVSDRSYRREEEAARCIPSRRRGSRGQATARYARTRRTRRPRLDTGFGGESYSQWRVR